MFVVVAPPHHAAMGYTYRTISIVVKRENTAP
jgi:hypothetical protein